MVASAHDDLDASAARRLATLENLELRDGLLDTLTEVRREAGWSASWTRRTITVVAEITR